MSEMKIEDLTCEEYDTCWGHMTDEEYDKIKDILPPHTVKHVQTINGSSGYIESWVWLKPGFIEENVPEALKLAVQAIYFNDNSDYLTALWGIVRAINPEAADLLERDEEAAYNCYAEEGD